MLEEVARKILEELPKALFGLLIPLLQFLWKKYREGGLESRKRSLRLKIADLSSQRESLSKVSAVADADHVLRDLDNELQGAITQLCAIGQPVPSPPHPSQRPFVSRLFLAYTPSGALSWIFHSLFYLNVAVVLLGLIGIAASWDSESAYGLLAIGVLLIPAFAFRSAALYHSAKTSQSAVSGEVLRKENPSKWRPFPATLFWIAVLLIPTAWLNFAEDDDFSGAVPATLFCLLFAVSALGWARSRSEQKQPLGRLRSGLLLFVPSRPAGWVGELAWYAGWTVILYRGPDAAAYGLTDLPVVILFLGLHLLCSWKWTQSFRPLAHTS